MFVNIIYMYSYFIPYFYANIVNKVLIIIIIIIPFRKCSENFKYDARAHSWKTYFSLTMQENYRSAVFEETTNFASSLP